MTEFDVEVFYDGACPLCMREIRMLQGRDQRGRIRFTDIAAEGFDAGAVGLPWEALMSRIHGRLPDGTTAETLGISAKVLLVDPSYRILTLRYPDGQIEALKPGLGTRMEQMSPGDSVAVRPREVTAVKIEKP